MSARYRFPPAEKSSCLSVELEDVPSDMKQDHKFGTHRLRYDPSVSMPPSIGGVCDGHRLYLQSSADKKLINRGNMFLYVLAIILLSPALISVFGKGDTSEFYGGGVAFLLVLSIALFNSWRYSRRAFTKFIVFDRDSGLVLFPKAGKWPDFTVPFEKVEVITTTYVGRGAAMFVCYLHALARPKGMRGKRRDYFMPGMVNSEIEALRQWCLINRFMDKSQAEPVPKEAYVTWVEVKWFMDQGLTIDRIMKEKGVIQKDPEKDWFDYDSVLPPPSEEAYQRARADALGLTLEESYRIFGVEKQESEADAIRW